MSVHTKLEPARRAGRKRVLMMGVLIGCSGAHPVRIRDVSTKGAQLVAENGFIPHGDVLLKRGELCAAAHVAWIKGDEIGVSFYREISAAELTRD